MDARENKLILRVNDYEKEIIQQNAEANHMSVSNFLRTLGMLSKNIEIETKIKQIM